MMPTFPGTPKRDRGTMYILERIDPTLWAQVKARAAAEGHPVRWIMLRLLELYARVGFDAITKDHRPDITTPPR
jgi:hypothetical protein